MKYEDFVCMMQTQMTERLGEGVQIQLHQILKNNSVVLDALSISEEGSGIAPTIYLNEFYRGYQEGVSIPDIADQMEALYKRSRVTASFDTTFYADYTKVKQRLACRLISREKNRELLKMVPYRIFLDLAIVVYYYFEDSRLGTGTILVYSSHCRNWGITEEELFACARENTLQLQPEEFLSMRSVLEKFQGRKEAKTKTDAKTGADAEINTDAKTGADAETKTDAKTGADAETKTDAKTGTDAEINTDTKTGANAETKTDTKTGTDAEINTDTKTDTDRDTQMLLPMYVLTNKNNYFGAASLLFDSVLQNIAGRLEDDFWVLPSSIHECIIVPAGAAMSREELQEMVREINRSEVAAEDFLSDEIYLYQREFHKLSL